MRDQNNSLRDQLQQLTMGQGIETDFIKEEDFATKKFSPFRQQTLKNIHDEIVDELCEIYDELDNEDDDDNDDDSDDSKLNIDNVINEETDTKSKFEILMERIGYEFLYNVLILCHNEMKQRKEKICQIIAKQLSVKSTIISNSIHPILQQKWKHYFKNEMTNIYDINVKNINIVIDEIYKKICQEFKQCQKWTFLRKKKTFIKLLKKYLLDACEICWIMILTKPQLNFYPKGSDKNNGFRMFVNNKNNEYLYNAKDKHDLCTGSKTKNAKIVFFSVPAITQKHFTQKSKHLEIIKGTLFAHNDQQLINFIMSQPEQLLSEQ